MIHSFVGIAGISLSFVIWLRTTTFLHGRAGGYSLFSFLLLLLLFLLDV